MHSLHTIPVLPGATSLQCTLNQANMQARCCLPYAPIHRACVYAGGRPSYFVAGPPVLTPGPQTKPLPSTPWRCSPLQIKAVPAPVATIGSRYTTRTWHQRHWLAQRVLKMATQYTGCDSASSAACASRLVHSLQRSHMHALGPPTGLLAALPLKCMGAVGSGNLGAWSRLLWLGGAYALTATLDCFLRLGSSFHM
jgi:hypothetical protein